jgi:hypothetical protein
MKIETGANDGSAIGAVPVDVRDARRGYATSSQESERSLDPS